MPAPSSEQLDYANMLLERAGSDSVAWARTLLEQAEAEAAEADRDSATDATESGAPGDS